MRQSNWIIWTHHLDLIFDLIPGFSHPTLSKVGLKKTFEPQAWAYRLRSGVKKTTLNQQVFSALITWKKWLTGVILTSRKCGDVVITLLKKQGFAGKNHFAVSCFCPNLTVGPAFFVATNKAPGQNRQGTRKLWVLSPASWLFEGCERCWKNPQVSPRESSVMKTPWKLTAVPENQWLENVVSTAVAPF